MNVDLRSFPTSPLLEEVMLRCSSTSRPLTMPGITTYDILEELLRRAREAEEAGLDEIDNRSEGQRKADELVAVVNEIERQEQIDHWNRTNRSRAKLYAEVRHALQGDLSAGKEAPKGRSRKSWVQDPEEEEEDY